MSNNKIILASFFLFHSFLVFLDDGSGIGRKIQVLFLFLFILIFNTRIGYIFKIGNKKVLYSLLIYVLSLSLTSVLNKNIDIHYMQKLNFLFVGNEYKASSFSLGIMYAIVIFMYFAFVEYLNRINKTDVFVNVIFKLCLFYCIVSDLFFLIGININREGTLIGNKFSLSYMHLYLVTFYCFRCFLIGRSIKLFYGYLLFALIASIYTKCTTALIGVLVLFLAYKYKNFFLRRIFNVKIIFACIFLCAAFPFFISALLNNSLVSYVITDILGEDLTLTGRIGIYETLSEVFILRPITGFGVGNGLMKFLFDAPNTQNGIANLFIEQGFIGVMSMFAITYACLNFVRQKGNRMVVFPIYAMIFTFIIMSTVEITIDTRFVVFLSLLLIYGNKSFPDRNLLNKY